MGQATRFYFTVSLGAVTAPPKELDAARQRKVVHLADGYHVEALVVDDVAENRDVLSKLLSDIGVSVQLAENGQQALDLIRQVATTRDSPSHANLQSSIINPLTSCSWICGCR